MKRNGLVILLVIACLTHGCSTTNLRQSSIQYQDDVIRIAIENFSKIKSLYSKESVFSLSVKKLTQAEDLVVVRIGKSGSRFPVSAKDIQNNTFRLPTQYLIKDGKLFYWWDDDSVMQKEALGVYRKYGIIKDVESEFELGDHIYDDSQKAAHFYFCKKDLNSFKLVITNRGVGYYPPPSMGCGSDNLNFRNALPRGAKSYKSVQVSLSK